MKQNFGRQLLSEIHQYDPIILQWVWRIDDSIMLEDELRLSRKLGGNQVFIKQGNSSYKVQIRGQDKVDIYLEGVVTSIGELIEFIEENLNRTFII